MHVKKKIQAKKACKTTGLFKGFDLQLSANNEFNGFNGFTCDNFTEINS